MVAALLVAGVEVLDAVVPPLGRLAPVPHHRSEIGDEPVVARLPLNIVESDRNNHLKNYLKFPDDAEVGELITVEIASKEQLSTESSSVFSELIEERGGKVSLCISETTSYNGDPNDAVMVFDSLEPGQKVSFRVSEPGFYYVMLGVRGSRGGWFQVGNYIGGFTCLYHERSGTIQFDKPSYRPGEKVNATLKADWRMHNADYGSVSVLTPSGQRIRCNISEDAPDHRSVHLPLEGGIFQMRWYSMGMLVSAAAFRVPVELEPDRLRVVGGREIEYGEPIKVEVEFDDRPLFVSYYANAHVSLYSRGEMSPTGAWKGPKRISDCGMKESGACEFESPFPGRYEVRLCAGQYIVARVPVEVSGPGGEVPAPGHPDAPEPTDIPFRAKEYGSAIANNIRMADVHCAEFHPLPMVDASGLAETVASTATESTEHEPNDGWPAYPKSITYFPRFCDRTDVFGTGTPRPAAPEWRDLIPEEVAASVNEAWVLITVLAKGIATEDIDLASSSIDPLSHADDPYIDEYRLLQAATMDWSEPCFDEGYNALWHRLRDRIAMTMAPNLHMQRLAGADAFVVMAKLKLGSPAGVHRFEINGVPCEWTQANATTFGDVGLVREMSDGEYLNLASAYLYDRFQVQITVPFVVDADELPFFFQAKSASGTNRILIGEQGEWSARRSAEDSRVYRSEAFFINPSGRPHRNPSDIANVIELHDGNLLLAQIPQNGIVLARTPGLVWITSSPGRIGDSWREAVYRAAVVAKCAPTGGLNALTRETAAELAQSGFFPFTSEFEVEIQVGDLAAMILMRDSFIRDMRPLRTRLDSIRTSCASDPAAGEALRSFLYQAARGPESPIGGIKISSYAGTELAIPGVPFAFVYDRDYLNSRFRGVRHLEEEWKRVSVQRALDRYIEAVDSALKRAVEAEDKDVEDLVEITGTCFDTVRARLMPTLLRLREDRSRQTLWWEPDPVAMSHMGSIPELFKEWHANHEVIEAEHEFVLVASLLGFVLPEVVVARAASAVLSYGLLAESAFHDIPKWLDERTEAEFAFGAMQVLGEGRLELARLEERSFALVALNLVGSVAGAVADTARLVQSVDLARTAARGESLLDAVEEGGVSALMVMGREDQAQVIALIGDAERSAAAEQPLTSLQKRALQVKGEMQQRIKDCDPVRMHPMEERFEQIRGGTVAPPEVGPPELTLRRMKTEAMSEAEPLLRVGVEPPLNVGIAEKQPWGPFEVGKSVGKGEYATVFGLKGLPPSVAEKAAQMGLQEGGAYVIKAFEKSEKGLDAIKRAKHVEGLLAEKGIEQMRIVDDGMVNGFPYLIQERIPKGAVMYPHKGHVRLPPEHTKALLELYQDIGKAGLGWEDGHLENIYFLKKKDTWVAGVVDQDRVWNLNLNMHEQPMGASANMLMYRILRAPGNYHIGSLQGQRFTDTANAFSMSGDFVFPDGEYFMMKMLEHKAFIRFDRATGTFNDWLLDVDEVKKVFKNLDDPASIDSFFDVPSRLDAPDVPVPEAPLHSRLTRPVLVLPRIPPGLAGVTRKAA